MYNFDPYNVLLAFATNIPVLLMTAFVLQGPNIISNVIVLVIMQTKSFYLLFVDFWI